MADMEKFQDQEFIEYVVRAIVNHPEDVRTERTIDENGVLIMLYVNQEDMGYVIGRQGQTARSLRTLLKIVGAKEKARVSLKVYEPEGARKQRFEAEGREERAERSNGGLGSFGARHDDRPAQQAPSTLGDIDISAIDLEI